MLAEQCREERYVKHMCMKPRSCNLQLYVQRSESLHFTLAGPSANLGKSHLGQQHSTVYNVTASDTLAS